MYIHHTVAERPMMMPPRRPPRVPPTMAIWWFASLLVFSVEWLVVEVREWSWRDARMGVVI